MFQIELDACNVTSLYLQIRDQIISLIDKGVLNAGNRLPATRELSSKLNNNFFPEEKTVCDRLTSEGIGVRPGCFSLHTPSPKPSFRLSRTHLGEIEIEKGLSLMCRVLSELHKEQNNG